MTNPTPPARFAVHPLYLKLSVIVLALGMLGHILKAVQEVLVPLLFALLLAMLLDPAVQWMQRRVHRVVSITVAVLLAMTLLAALAYFIATQAAHFSEALPKLKDKLQSLQDQLLDQVKGQWAIEEEQVEAAVDQVKDQGMAKTGTVVSGTLVALGTLFGFFFLLPVFTFLLLFYKRLLLAFVARLFPVEHHRQVAEALGEIKGVTASYLLGLVFEAGIVTALNYAGLLLIGVPYALLLAVLAAVLNLIPYIGMIIATVLPMVLALATMQPVDALYVLLLYAAVQFVDNNLIVPRVVASRIQLNALVSIVVVMLGGLLWGVAGMFLSLPLTAMLKVVFDRVDALNAFGQVLGDDDPQGGRAIFGRGGVVRHTRKPNAPRD